MGFRISHLFSGKNQDPIPIKADDDPEPYIDIVVQLTPQEEQRRTTWHYKVRKFLWDSVDKHPVERSFLVKLDYFLLSSAMLGYFIKTLNSNNMATAYVNGMREYYGMENNQYNYLTTLWTVGYIIGQVPSNLILHRISARYYLASLEFIWGVLTVLMITCKSLPSLYAIRFLVGFTEAGYFPGLEYLIGSWYSKEELNKRLTFFALAGTAAGLISGPLQQRILKNFAHSSLPPFKWMFVFDAVISFPVSFYTLIADPNTPSTTTSWYFTKRDRLVALERRRRIGAQLNSREKYTVKKIKSFFNTWHIWIFPWLFLCFNNSAVASILPFPTWMKYDLKLTPAQYNQYPSAASGGQIAYALILAYISDYTKNRYIWLFISIFFIATTWGCIMLSVWNIPIGLHWFSYFLIAIPLSSAQPMIFAWVNGILAHDDMKRNFVVVCTNVLAYVTNAWVPILVWNTNDQPRFFKGFVYTACLTSLGLGITLTVRFLANRDEKRKQSYYISDETNSGSDFETGPDNEFKKEVTEIHVLEKGVA